MAPGEPSARHRRDRMRIPVVSYRSGCVNLAVRLRGSCYAKGTP